MFNNINDNQNEFLYNSRFGNQNNVININSYAAGALKNPYVQGKNPYVDRTDISGSAIELFQKDVDIKKFNKIAMSDLGDMSHLDKMKELFASGVVDVFEDDVLSELVTNSKLWDDLEL